MRFDRTRLSEIVEATVSTLSRRGRLVLIAACGAVLVVSWWGAQRFADRLLTQIPTRSGPEGPVPLTETEMQEQIRQAQELNVRIRNQRDAARAYAQGRLADSLGTFTAIEWDAESPSAEGALGPDGAVATAALDILAEPLAPTRPEMPELALQSGVTGTVIVRALVGPDGRVLDTAIERSIPMLNGAAESTVRRWRFRPAVSEGRAVASWTRVPVTFAR
jgi:TonB family protein